MSAMKPPKKPDRIYYSGSLGLASTIEGEGDIPYVPADIADRHKAQRDRLLEAAKNHLQETDLYALNMAAVATKLGLLQAIAECQGEDAEQ